MGGAVLILGVEGALQFARGVVSGYVALIFWFAHWPPAVLVDDQDAP